MQSTSYFEYTLNCFMVANRQFVLSNVLNKKHILKSNVATTSFKKKL